MLYRSLLTLGAAAAVGLACASPVMAQSDYPTKPLTIMVGANPGGGSDAVARLLAQKFTEILGKSVVVENRPGASNTIGAAAAAKAKPDGYTLFVGSSTPISIAPHLLELGYNTLKDLQPAGLICLVPNIFVINKDMGINTVAELVDYMKKNPNKVKYGSSGLGSTHVVITEQFNISAGVKSVHVPYPGSAPTQIDIIAGVIHMTIDSAAAVMPQIKAGNLKPIAVTSPKRVPDLPNVPTITEAGYPDVAMQTMYGLYTTGGTPRPIVEKINATLNKTLQDPEVIKRLGDIGGTVQPMSVADFEVFNKKDYDTYGMVIDKANIKAMK